MNGARLFGAANFRRRGFPVGGDTKYRPGGAQIAGRDR